MAWPVRAVQPDLPRRSASEPPWRGADDRLDGGYALVVLEGKGEALLVSEAAQRAYLGR